MCPVYYSFNLKLFILNNYELFHVMKGYDIQASGSIMGV